MFKTFIVAAMYVATQAVQSLYASSPILALSWTLEVA